MNSELIEKKLGSIENLPSLPIVLRQLQKVIQNPRSSMEQIAAIVAKDPALASRTIRLVNSAYYAFNQKVTSISHAIVIIGLNTLNTLMIGLTLIKMFNNTKILGFDQQKFWEHCFGTALLSKSLAECKGIKEGEDYFVNGLLHDMGRLVLDQFLHEEFYEAMIKARSGSLNLHDCETEVIGFDHADAGQWLAAKWGLPETIIVSLGFHHRESALPDEYTTHREALRIISNANKLCAYAGIGSSGETCGVPKSLDFFSIDGITSKQVQDIIVKVRADLKMTIDEWNKAL